MKNHILHEIYIDEEITFSMIKENLIPFMEGNFDTKIIKNYLGDILDL
jgi:hypothetical protein